MTIGTGYLYYIKQGNKGFILPIKDVENKDFNPIFYGNLKINGKKTVRLGKSYMFDIAPEYMVSSIDNLGGEEFILRYVTLIDLGSIGSKGDFNLNDDIPAESLDNATLEISYRKVPITSLVEFKELKSLPTEDMGIYTFTKEMCESLISSYLVEKANSDVRLHFTVESSYSNKYSLSALKTKTFTDVKEAVMDNNLKGYQEPVKNTKVFYEFNTDLYKGDIFYTKEEFSSYIDDFIAELDKTITDRINEYFNKEAL